MRQFFGIKRREVRKQSETFAKRDIFSSGKEADRRIVRLIQKWLRAGVLEDGRLIQNEEGTVQGGSISPLLANIYLHYVFDLWASQWRRRSHGDVIIVRFADDFVTERS